MARQPHPLPSPAFPATLVEAVLEDALAAPGKPAVYAISGMQGSGKSTLAAQLVAAGAARGLLVVALSIDDFYLGRRERQVLARRVHPLLATRGPPGSHDLVLAGAVLDRLRGLRPGDCVGLPRFDKLRDRRLPPSKWRQLCRRPDLIVFEGWFLGVAAQSAAALRKPLNRLERDQDPDGTWRRYCNDALVHYAPLWQRFDRLLWLRAPGFELVPGWRWQQQAALQSARPAAPTMSRAQVDRFVLLFERITRHAQATLPRLADRVVELDAERGARLRRR